ncbi:ABC transporter permease [Ruminiclostridium josui]|uniref:ABC transporter permease n=1 Tax=Ruminiclostridium josui TaxID=1499 RepID=UPI0009EBAF27|nr:ABC transporter permease [Ruminiclostridium josui]
MLRAELYKYFRMHLISITFFASIIWVLCMLYFVISSKIADVTNIGLGLYVFSRYLFCAIAVPAYIILITRVAGEMEQRNNNWGLLLSMPIKKGTIYFAKIITLLGMIFVFYAGYTTGILFIGGIASNFQLPVMEILLELLLSFICTFSILSFFYVFSLENFNNHLSGSGSCHFVIWIFGYTVRNCMDILPLVLSDSSHNSQFARIDYKMYWY